VSIGKISVSAKKVEAVADCPVSTTPKEVRSFGHLCTFYAKSIHHFSDLAAHLTDLLRKSQPHNLTVTFASLEAFETLNLAHFRAMLDPSGG
jgi:hypothetical protein